MAQHPAVCHGVPVRAMDGGPGSREQAQAARRVAPTTSLRLPACCGSGSMRPACIHAVAHRLAIQPLEQVVGDLQAAQAGRTGWRVDGMRHGDQARPPLTAAAASQPASAACWRRLPGAQPQLLAPAAAAHLHRHGCQRPHRHSERLLAHVSHDQPGGLRRVGGLEQGSTTDQTSRQCRAITKQPCWCTLPRNTQLWHQEHASCL